MSVLPPHPKLTADLLVRKESLPETIRPQTASGARINVTYRPLESTHERLRAVSYATRRPIQAIMDEAVLAWLDAHPNDE
jgi:hypothetical protein